MRAVYLIIISVFLVNCSGSSSTKQEITDISELEGVWLDRDEEIKYIIPREDSTLWFIHKLEFHEDIYGVGECYTNVVTDPTVFLKYKNDKIYYGVNYYTSGYGQYVNIYSEDDTVTIESINTKDVNYFQAKKIGDDLDVVHLCDFTLRPYAVTDKNEMYGLWTIPNSLSQYFVGYDLLFIDNKSNEYQGSRGYRYDHNQQCYTERPLSTYFFSSKYPIFTIYISDAEYYPITERYLVSRSTSVDSEKLVFTTFGGEDPGKKISLTPATFTQNDIKLCSE